ncbi:diaminopimelate epimerase [Niameybacter massiliensis]|uniref:diaminopimelate epimerase n=1 Tax=Niameybacter massiliensis TaxID=1658108 RepID=UPI0006B50F1B|nr:diaminopimelate epimerase [Niameybacter massiliensis]
MLRKFIKMEGCGNDYIYFDCLNEDLPHPEQVSITVSDRHFGIGGDGIVLICTSDVADAKMRMFNTDGSEGKMCGNAIRCVGKYLYDHKIVTKESIDIETLSGIKHLKLNAENGQVQSVCVDMGAPILEPKAIPVNLEGTQIVHQDIQIGRNSYPITCVSMGNPHCIIFVEEVASMELEKIGPLFEHAEIFPEQVNTEFVRVIDEHTLEMRVWERGSGETLACGTGACATVVGAVLNGICKQNEEVTVKLRGGELKITYSDETVYMTGAARKTFEGVVEL